MSEKTLIITEKPSVARDFAKILHVSGTNAGFIENERYVITWCVGHLIEMCYPEKYDERYRKWRMEDLPFLPDEYIYEVIPATKKQYEVVKKALHRSDIGTILWAGDSGREGQLIEEYIRMKSGVRKGILEKRVWIDSFTEEEVMRGIKEAKPYAEYMNLANAGIMRSIEDYAMGINFSRAVSLRYGSLINEEAKNKKYAAVAIGRVMSCVLGMVVRREREIRDFKPTDFYRIMGEFSLPKKPGPKSPALSEGPGADSEAGAVEQGSSFIGEWNPIEGTEFFSSPLVYNGKGFLDRDKAQEFIDSLASDKARIKNIKKSTEKKQPPFLFNLAELQAACSKLFSIGPDQTLSVLQSLYEKKLTTYPRTDSRFLSSAVAKVIEKNIKGLSKYSPVAEIASEVLENKKHLGLLKTKYVNDGKVTDHYAIIPTGVTGGMNRLSDLEGKVFDLVARRFLSIFYPPAVYRKLSIETVVSRGEGEESFFTNVKELEEEGYLRVTGHTSKKNSGENGDMDSIDIKKLSGLRKGTVLVPENYFVKEGRTKPPSRYTSGSMILAMENAGNLIEDEELRSQIKGAGIGTSATRAGIIAKLVKIGYMAQNKKTQVLTPRAFGEMVYETVLMTIPSMLSPEMTASWEKGLSMVENGELPPKAYQDKLNNYVSKYVLRVRRDNLQDEIHKKCDKVKSFYK